MLPSSLDSLIRLGAIDPIYSDPAPSGTTSAAGSFDDYLQRAQAGAADTNSVSSNSVDSLGPTSETKEAPLQGNTDADSWSAYRPSPPPPNNSTTSSRTTPPPATAPSDRNAASDSATQPVRDDHASISDDASRDARNARKQQNSGDATVPAKPASNNKPSGDKDPTDTAAVVVEIQGITTAATASQQSANPVPAGGVTGIASAQSSGTDPASNGNATGNTAANRAVGPSALPSAGNPVTVDATSAQTSAAAQISVATSVPKTNVGAAATNSRTSVSNADPTGSASTSNSIQPVNIPSGVPSGTPSTPSSTTADNVQSEQASSEAAATAQVDTNVAVAARRKLTGGDKSDGTDPSGTSPIPGTPAAAVVAPIVIEVQPLHNSAVKGANDTIASSDAIAKPSGFSSVGDAASGVPVSPAVQGQGSAVGANGSTSASGDLGLTQADRVRFVQRVEQAFQGLSDSGGTVRLRLSPPELGSLHIEISVNKGELTARVQTDTPMARNLLLDSLPALRDRLSQHDIKVQHFDVDLMDRSMGGTPDQTSQQQDVPYRTPSGLGRAASGPVGDASVSTGAITTNQPADSGRLNVIV